MSARFFDAKDVKYPDFHLIPTMTTNKWARSKSQRVAFRKNGALGKMWIKGHEVLNRNKPLKGAIFRTNLAKMGTHTPEQIVSDMLAQMRLITRE